LLKAKRREALRKRVGEFSPEAVENSPQRLWKTLCLGLRMGGVLNVEIRRTQIPTKLCFNGRKTLCVKPSSPLSEHYPTMIAWKTASETRLNPCNANFFTREASQDSLRRGASLIETYGRAIRNI